MFKTDETRQATWLTLCIWLLSGLLFSVTHAVLNGAITARVLATVAAMNLFGIIGLFGFPITLSLLKNLNDRGVIHILK